MPALLLSTRIARFDTLFAQMFNKAAKCIGSNLDFQLLIRARVGK